MTGRFPGIGAVILAAGESRRAGTPKALLEAQGKTFLENWLQRLGDAGIEEVRVVLGAHGDRIRRQVSLPEELVVVNERPQDGMLSSFVAGLGHLPETLAAAFLCPVDHPNVEAGDIRRLAERLEPGRIVLPVNGDRRGHPVLFAAELFPELASAPLEVGARAVVHGDPARIVEVPAGRGVLDQVNTPEDYQRLFKGA